MGKEIITCPLCKREMAVGNTRCPQCGADLTKTENECPKCHTKNLATSKFCKGCGKSLIEIINTPISQIALKCPKCQAALIRGAKFCKECGANVEATMQVYNETHGVANVGTPVDYSSYDYYLTSGSEASSIKAIIRKEMNSNPEVKGRTLPKVENKKLLFTFFYGVIVFIVIAIYMFFHTYLGLRNFLLVGSTGIYIFLVCRLSTIGFLAQEVSRRPEEKIGYIVATNMASGKKNKWLYVLAKTFILILCFGSILVLFHKPHMIYERGEGGYVLRYYTYGIGTEERTITVPETYKGKPVVGIRGDTFKNVDSVQKIVLPESIKEIRGGAFEGCTRLEEINLPKELIEIHGSTFKNCTSLREIVLPEGLERIGGAAFQYDISLLSIKIPESVVEIGGESFMGCSSLYEVNLPSKITEVHGSTFEDCTSLEAIEIPEGVTRIGGSAFRNCISLREAKVPTTVTEIGSSAFRGTALQTVCIPKSAEVNERAFKETWATIVYYEDNCEEPSYGTNFNDYFNNDYSYGDSYE
ncbi:MAG: leucine-rich repeat protein [Bacilli bacterium]|nr:leucine-rich repeat protein [Bacilli bacterium]